MLVMRACCPWRDMHERYGKWNSVYVRFRRWAEQGVWDALLETLVELGLTDNWQHMIDTTTIRGHSQAAGAKGGPIRKVLSKPRGFTSKIHARADGQGRPLGFVLTGGEVSDYKAVPTLLNLPITQPKMMLADKGYDGDDVRSSLLMHGILPVIPPKANRARSQSLATSKPTRIAIVERMFKPVEAVPTHCYPLRQDRSLIPQLPMPRCRKALVAILCQQSLILPRKCANCTKPVGS